MKSTDGLDPRQQVRYLDHAFPNRVWHELIGMSIDEAYSNTDITTELVTMLRHGHRRHHVYMD